MFGWDWEKSLFQAHPFVANFDKLGDWNIFGREEDFSRRKKGFWGKGRKKTLCQILKIKATFWRIAIFNETFTI